MAADPDAPFARVWLGARYVLRPVGRIALRPRVAGRERIPARGGAVIACTHVGLLDVLLVTQVLRRPTRFMAAAGVFRIPLVGAILRASGCFAVRRGERDTASVRQAIEIARAGGLVGIFPQGGLRHGTGLDELHRGAAMIALRAGVPLVPVGIGRGPAFVRVGEPLAPEGDARTLTAALSAALAVLVSPR
ncbi:MAG TPA: lysophospholipid acyltransferase family protein [Solirubrobacteraceae bacterium]|nr:lysophospholipid acyltransferase family protein [Solirubrobacteraceae bacterium]